MDPLARVGMQCGAEYQWVSASNGVIPNGAVMGGFQIDVLQPVYVGRAYHEGILMPAKVLFGYGSYVSSGGKEIAIGNYEVLCDDKVWVKTRSGNIPYGALPVGSQDGETTYIGRVYQNGLMLGKVHPTEGALYVAYGGKELRFENYEILIEDLRAQ